MSASSLDSEKLESTKPYTLARRFIYGPTLILALGAGSSAGLAVALLLASIL